MNDGPTTEIVPLKQAMSEQDLMQVLENSLYPGAKPASIAMVLAYCRANQLDPLLKPVHIVPMNVKVSSNPDRWEWRDVVMPGINSYRIAAARSGEYAGKGEPIFGDPVQMKLGGVDVTFPLWCKVTVQRLVRGQVRDFTATEFWLENYASVKSGAPNNTWSRRVYAQLAKCAEAQALRMAFPELNGHYTFEEMEGKAGFDGPTIEGTAERPAQQQNAPRQQTEADKAAGTPAQSYREQVNQQTPMNEAPKKMTAAEWLDGFEIACKACKDINALNAIIASPQVQKAMQWMKDALLVRLQSIMAIHISRLAPRTEETTTTTTEAQAPAEDGQIFPPDGDDGWPGPKPGEAGA